MRSRALCLLLLSILSCVFASPKHELARTLDSPVLADVEGARYVFDINATLPTLQKRACPTDDVAALTTALAMQSLYYNKNGSYNGGEAWTDVQAMEDLMNLMLFNNITEFEAEPEAVFTHWDSTFRTAGDYESAQWGALASFKQCDYLAAHGRDTTECLSRGLTYYNFASANWDAVCKGGVWSSSAKTYKNSITTELFLYTSAAGYARTGQPGLLSNAELAWNWLNSTDLRNSEGLYNDGLSTSTCTNNGENTWTYNQIVVAAGLASLYDATGNKTYLDVAQVSIDAAIAKLQSDSVLKESCDSRNQATTCTTDEQMFKGIFMKHLGYFLDMANDPAITKKYSSFIRSQGSAVILFATEPISKVGSVWYGFNAGGSQFTPQSQTAGLAALNAAAKYGEGLC